MSWPRIADWLIAHGVRTSQGGTRWYASSARHVYLGAKGRSDT
jgi:hypothetical protein